MFTAIVGFFRGRDRRLTGQTSLWMFPIYGLVEPFYEPLHNALRGRLSGAGRGLVYALGFLAVEYVSGRCLRRLSAKRPGTTHTHATTCTALSASIIFRCGPVPDWPSSGSMTD